MARVAVAAVALVHCGWPSLWTCGYHSCHTHSHSRTFARAPRSLTVGTDVVVVAVAGGGGGTNAPLSHQ